MRVGRLRQCDGIAEEYRVIALADEEAASVLQKNGQSRQAMYFLVQAMEKHVRAKIFTLVNPNLEWVRDKNRCICLPGLSREQVVIGRWPGTVKNGAEERE